MYVKSDHDHVFDVQNTCVVQYTKEEWSSYHRYWQKSWVGDISKFCFTVCSILLKSVSFSSIPHMKCAGFLILVQNRAGIKDILVPNRRKFVTLHRKYLHSVNKTSGARAVLILERSVKFPEFNFWLISTANHIRRTPAHPGTDNFPAYQVISKLYLFVILIEIFQTFVRGVFRKLGTGLILMATWSREYNYPRWRGAAANLEGSHRKWN